MAVAVTHSWRHAVRFPQCDIDTGGCMLGDRGGGAPTGSGPADPEVAWHSVHEPASAFHLNPPIMERPRPRGLLCTAHRIRSRPSRGHRPLYETSDHDRHEHSVQVIGRYVWRRPPVFSTRTRRGLPSVRCRATRPPNSPVTAPFPGLPRLPPVRDIAATQSPMSSACTRHSPTSRPSEWPCKSAH